MNNTTKSTTAKLNSTRSNSPASREASTVAVESLVSPLIATREPITPAKSTQQKEKETAEDHKAQKDMEATIKQAAKTKAVKPLAETGHRLTRSQVAVSTVIDCTKWSISLGILTLVPVYYSKRNIVAMAQVPEDPIPLAISADIPSGKTCRYSTV